jgi:glucokinase
VAGARGWRRRAEERLAQRPSVLRGAELDPRTIVEAARSGDAVALEVVDGAAAALGVGLAAGLNLLNLDRVVLGGGVAAAGPFLLERIVEQTRRRTFAQVFADCSFRAAELGNDAGVLGAARAAQLAGG